MCLYDRLLAVSEKLTLQKQYDLATEINAVMDEIDTLDDVLLDIQRGKINAEKILFIRRKWNGIPWKESV